jgi:hypothetical protein
MLGSLPDMNLFRSRFIGSLFLKLTNEVLVIFDIDIFVSGVSDLMSSGISLSISFKMSLSSAIFVVIEVLSLFKKAFKGSLISDMLLELIFTSIIN